MRLIRGFIVILTYFLIISAVSAVQIGISPGEIEFNSDPMKVTCKVINVYTQNNLVLSGEDKWANTTRTTRNMNDYRYKASDFGLSIGYIKEVGRNNTQVKVCIAGVKPGNYQGALVYSAPSVAGVGTWIKVNIYGQSTNSGNSQNNAPEDNENEDTNAPITGAAIGFGNLIYVPMIASTLILLIVLLVLLRINKKISIKDEEVKKDI